MQDSTQPDLTGIRHAADWAETFGRGETNLAMRAKHAADVDAFNAALQQQHQDELMRQISTGKNALDFWKATQQMRLREQMHAADMAAAAPLHQAQQDAALAAADAHRASALHTSAAEKRTAAELLARTAAQEQFDAARHSAGEQFGYGSPEYHKAVMEADAATPAAPAAFKSKHVGEAQKFLEAQPVQDDTAGFNNHMAELISRGVAPQSDEWQAGLAVGMATFPQAHPQTVARYGPAAMPAAKAGAVEHVTAEERALKNDEQLLKGYVLARSKLSTPTGELPVQTRLLDEKIKEISGRLEKSRSGTATKPTASTAAPKAAEARPVFKDAKGNRAYRNPDGSFEPIQ